MDAGANVLNFSNTIIQTKEKNQGIQFNMVGMSQKLQAATHAKLS